MGRRKTRPLGRRGGSAPGSRSPKEVVHFCVEGLTEERYLRALLEHRYPEILVPRFLGRRGKGRAWKTSLVNLVRAAKQGERSWQRSERGQVIWIVADAAANEVHQAELQRWLDDAVHHQKPHAIPMKIPTRSRNQSKASGVRPNQERSIPEGSRASLRDGVASQMICHATSARSPKSTISNSSICSTSSKLMINHLPSLPSSPSQTAQGVVGDREGHR